MCQAIIESGKKKFSLATCTTNTAIECILSNSKREKDGTAAFEKACQKNEYCILKNVNIAEKFSFSFCSPRYPKVFDEDSYEVNEELCAAASVKCTVVDTKGFFSGWSCTHNCE